MFYIIVMYYSNINKMSCFYLFISVLYVYLHFSLRISKLKIVKVLEKDHSGI